MTGVEWMTAVTEDTFGLFLESTENTVFTEWNEQGILGDSASPRSLFFVNLGNIRTVSEYW